MMQYHDLTVGAKVWFVCAIPGPDGALFGAIEIASSVVNGKKGKHASCRLRIGDSDRVVWINPNGECMLDDESPEVDVRFPLRWFDNTLEAAKWCEFVHKYPEVPGEMRLIRTPDELRAKLRTASRYESFHVSREFAESFDILDYLDLVRADKHNECFGHGGYRDMDHLDGPEVSECTYYIGVDGAPVVTERKVSVDRLSAESMMRIVDFARAAKEGK